jgi:hypothetical protein
MIYASIYQFGVIVLFVTSLPVALDHGAGLPGFLVGFLAISLGVAGFKATLAPFLSQSLLKQPCVLRIADENVAKWTSTPTRSSAQSKRRKTLLYCPTVL